MTIDEYQTLALRTLRTEFDADKQLANGVMGLCGEAGEVADLVKKHLYQGHELNPFKVIEELGDVCWYIAEICEAVGASMETVMERNIDKLKRRYPDGFEAERSINRPEYRTERKESGLTDE